MGRLTEKVDDGRGAKFVMSSARRDYIILADYLSPSL